MRASILAVAAIVACDSKKEREKTPAEVASALVGNDVSPLDVASATPAMYGEPWDPALCDVVPEKEKSASLSDLTATGACAFVHHGTAVCSGTGDDYYALIQRRLADGSELAFHLNVEAYTGAGTYEKKSQVLVLVRRGQVLYRWSNDEGTATLGFAEGGGVSSTPHHVPDPQGATPTIVHIDPIELRAEPGTPTRGTIKLEGTIACVLKKPPK